MVKTRLATLYKLSGSKLTLERQGVITDIVMGKDSSQEDSISLSGLGNLVADLGEDETLVVLITKPTAGAVIPITKKNWRDWRPLKEHDKYKGFK